MKAFPSKGYIQSDEGILGEAQFSGMDLRDYFACNAPIYMDEAFESLSAQTKTVLTDKYDEEVFDEVARLSYLYADAMMKARDQ